MENPTFKGPRIVKNFLDLELQARLTVLVDSGCWSTELERRVQHFGYRYDYRARRVSPAMKAAPLPEWGKKLIRQMIEADVSSQKFDQLIVNEYLPGQGIAPHVDSLACFDNDIVSISLGSSCVMTLSHLKRDEGFEVLLAPGDLLLLRDDMRFQWRHEIKPRKSDTWKGQVIERTRRLSLTFRKVLLQPR